MTPLFKKFLTQNWLFLANVIVLLVIGVFTVYSATGWRDDAALQGLWLKHLFFAGLGLVMMLALSLIDYSWIRFGCIPLYVGALALLVLVRVHGIEVYDARSWLRLPGGFTMQPSQLALFAGVLSTGVILAELPKWHAVFRYPLIRLATSLVVVGIPMLMVLKEPDLGSAIVWGPTLAAMLIASNIPWRYLISLVLLIVIPLPWAFFVTLKPYQQKRITTWIRILSEQEVNIRDEAYSAHYAQVAVATGGMEGKGYLAHKVENQKSIQRMGFIAEKVAANDYIFAVAAEEHGFRGMLILLGIYSFLLLQILFMASISRDSLGRIIAAGGAAVVFSHLMLNAGLNTNLLPATGVPLPFISYGGTFLVVLMSMMGMTQSVWVHHKLLAPSQERTLLPQKNRA